jgi:hypothetical protein
LVPSGECLIALRFHCVVIPITKISAAGKALSRAHSNLAHPNADYKNPHPHLIPFRTAERRPPKRASRLEKCYRPDRSPATISCLSEITAQLRVIDDINQSPFNEWIGFGIFL